MNNICRLLMPVMTAVALLMGMTTSAFADDSAKHIGRDIASIPLFDAHVHYKEPCLSG